MIAYPSTLPPGITAEQFDAVVARAPAARAPKTSGGPRETYSRKRLARLVGLLPNDKTVDRDRWVNVGHGVKAMCETDEDGFEVFDGWSEMWEGDGVSGYDRDYTRNFWDGVVLANVRTKGGKLKQMAAEADPDGFAAWQAEEAFDDGGVTVGGERYATDQVSMSNAIADKRRGALTWIEERRWAEFVPGVGWLEQPAGNHALHIVKGEAQERLKLGVSGKGASTKLRSTDYLSGVARLMSVDPGLHTSWKRFDQDPLLLGVPSGVIDLGRGSTHDVRPATAADMALKRMAVDPAPKGTTHPVWSKFLAEFSQGDATLEDWLQAYAGYALTGMTREHLMPFFFGGGGNGKSVFINTLRGLWGDYGAAIDHRLLFEKVGGFHLAPLAALLGVRLGSVCDVPAGSVWDKMILKTLTGGDTVAANRMHGDTFNFTPCAKLMISGNERPGIKDIDDGVKRRMRLLPMKSKPARKDEDLPQKLRAEWPAIFRWALEGLSLYWTRSALPPCARIDAETDDYLTVNDPFGRWIAAHLRADPAAKEKLRVGDLFRSWEGFRSAENAFGASPKSAFAMPGKLEDHGVIMGRDNVGRFLTGYRLGVGDAVYPF